MAYRMWLELRVAVCHDIPNLPILPWHRQVTDGAAADRIGSGKDASLSEGMISNWLIGAARRLAISAVCLILATPAEAESVKGLWAVVPDGSTAVKLAIIGLRDGDDEPRLFRISCDQWGAVDLVFFGDAELMENADYDLTLRINGQAEIFRGKAERSDMGSVLYWSSTVGLTHPLFDRLAYAHRLEISINGLTWRLPIAQLSWSLDPFRDWCHDLAPSGTRP